MNSDSGGRRLTLKNPGSTTDLIASVPSTPWLKMQWGVRPIPFHFTHITTSIQDTLRSD